MKNKVVFRYCVTGELIKNVLSFLIIFLVVSFFFTSPVYSQQRQFSPEFISLMTQVQQIYLAPRGATIEMLENQAPASLATVIGHAMRQQWPYVQQIPSLQNSFANLQYEVQGYLGEVAKITRDPGPRGQGVTGEMLWNFTSRAMQGHDDNWVQQNFGVQTGMMPSIFAGGPGTQHPQSFLKPPFVEREPPRRGDKLDLLGVSPENVPQGSIPPYPWGMKPPKGSQESSSAGIKEEYKSCKYWDGEQGQWRQTPKGGIWHVKGETPTLLGDCRNKKEFLCCDNKGQWYGPAAYYPGDNCICVSQSWLYR